MKKTFGISISLVVALASGSVFAEGSINPRDARPESIPGKLTQNITKMVSEVGLGEKIVEFADPSSRESVVLGVVDLKGAVSFTTIDKYSDFAKGGAHQLIPFKVSYAEDGSYDLSVGVYKFENKDNIDNTKFWNWISIDNVTLLEMGRTKEKYSDRSGDSLNYINGDVRIGLLQSESKRTNLYITVGGSLGRMDQSIPGQDGSVNSFDGDSNTFRYGLNLDSQTKNGWLFETSIGVQEKRSKGKLTPQSLIFQNQQQIADYEFAQGEFGNTYQNYLDEKLNWELARDLAPLSEVSYYNQTGISQPIFDLDFPSGPGTVAMTRTTRAFNPSMSVKKKLQNKNVTLGFRVDGYLIIDDDIKGSGHIINIDQQDSIVATFTLGF